MENANVRKSLPVFPGSKIETSQSKKGWRNAQLLTDPSFIAPRLGLVIFPGSQRSSSEKP